MGLMGGRCCCCEAQVGLTLRALHSDNTRTAWVFAPALFWPDSRPVINAVPTHRCWWNWCSGNSAPLPNQVFLNMLGGSSPFLLPLHAKAAFNLTFGLEQALDLSLWDAAVSAVQKPSIDDGEIHHVEYNPVVQLLRPQLCLVKSNE
ncbi:hypothetical protein GOODEAATRI_016806 [Goodea atripinnis]|uniref:Uncharacterized protein n=1 Tax=Goodea atripinnis TaxID=208336 RepID=A0ABV0MIG4_9TELE